MITEIAERQIGEVDFTEPRLSEGLPCASFDPESALVRKIGEPKALRLQRIIRVIDQQELPLEDSQALLAFKVLLDISQDAKSVLEMLYGKPITNLQYRTWRNRGVMELTYEFRKLEQALGQINLNGSKNSHN